MDNCFLCQSYTAKNCLWENEKCSQKSTQRQIDRWWNTFDGCSDEFNLCRYVEFNSTFIEFNIDFNETKSSDLIEDIIP